MISQGFTVIIPTRNRPASAFGLLKHLREELGWECCIVVVDQSDDHGEELASLVKAADLQNVHTFYDDRRGTSAGRNAGAKLAKTEWLLFLDDDVRPANGYLEALSPFITENPWLDAVQAGLDQRDAWNEYQSEPKRWLTNRREKPRIRKAYPVGWNSLLFFTSSPWARYETLTIGVASGNLAISRRAFIGVGGFDEQIDGLGDDREFGLRLWWYGYRVCMFPEAVAFHLREPQGGSRQTKSGWARLFNPDPAIGWVYFHLKWFPGDPYRHMIRQLVVKWSKRPWTLPIRLVRLWRSISLARERLKSGPRYISLPVSRSQLLAQGKSNGQKSMVARS